MNAKIEAALGGEDRFVFFSAYDEELIPGVGHIPVDNLHKTAVTGAVTFPGDPD